ncbi:MAG: Transporter, LysE family [Pseudolabrys sp.]|jgi:RhtB (resistance to homoserine/threonine) family protein|nr:Transporter, LysE family [Pseudolabrys sp.]
MPAILLALAAFTAAATVFAMTPGADTALVLRTAAADGPRHALAAAIGVCLGCFVWGAGAAFGLTALLAASALAYTILKWIGAAYLAVLGIKMLVHPRDAAAAAESGALSSRQRDAFRRGLLTNLLNPKVGVFYITVLPQFVPHGAPVGAFSLALAAIHVMVSLVWFTILISLTVPLGRFLAQTRVVRALDRLTGCIFIAFGARLALDARP